MTGSRAFGPGVQVIIDLTNSDDDDNGDAPPVPPPKVNGNDSHARPISSLARAPALAPAPAPAHVPAPAVQYRGGEEPPPAKRIKVDNGQHATDTAYTLIHPYAEAGARQAVQEDPRLDQRVLKDKLQVALLHQFGNRITQQLTLNGGIFDSVRGEILLASRNLLRQLVTLSECRRPSQPNAQRPIVPAISAPAPAPTPGATSSSVRPLKPMSYDRPRSGNIQNGRSHSMASPLVNRVSVTSPPLPDGLPSPQLPQNSPMAAPARQFADPANSHLAGSRGLHPVPQSPFQAPSAHHPTHQQLGAQALRPLVPPPRTRVQQYSPVVQNPTIQTPLAQQGTPRPVSRDTKPPSEPSSTPRRSRGRNLPGTPSSKEARSNVNAPTTPQNFHARAKTAQWKSDTSSKVETKPTSFFALKRRPYAGTQGKEAILRGNGRLSRLKPNLLQKPEVFHVDFTLDEVHKLLGAARKAVKRGDKVSTDPHYDLRKLLKRLKEPSADMVRLVHQLKHELPAREEDDVLAFLNDIFHQRVRPHDQQILSVEKDTFDTRGEDLLNSRLASLLLAREFSGNRYGGTRRLENFTNEFPKIVESGLQIRSEFTNCAGDVSTISWISDQTYVAGTTVHMDSHNQQYNKPGNLVLGSACRGNASLKAYADHRIIRPIVEKGENSSAAMRETQDPWLYTSVVFSDYDPIHKRLYTCSFDKTVKAWKVQNSGASMRCIGTWKHEGSVNFVQACLFQDRASLVATAADVPCDAVRIYQVSEVDDELPTSRFTPYSCSRILDADGIPLVTDKWTYFPSTMKWGIEKSVQQYLLVGYSPRSISGDDGDIPPERSNTGEICIWDASTGERVNITGSKSQNVFEVLWHPSQPYFIAATSPKGVDFKDNRVRTQVRIFRRVVIAGVGVCFSEWKALDCMAADINELTIMPNSVIYCYVTAGCTDGKTYVWDTALGDKPIQVLEHDPPLEGIRVNDAEDDTGVKFTAWGSSLDRFYTGSSDGVVKVWNVRSAKRAKGKVILEASAQISAGAFSPDRSRLVVGDASGRVFVLSVDEDDGKPPTFIKLPGAHGIIKRPVPTQVEHHAAPPPPAGTVDISGVSAAGDFLAAQQLKYTGDPTVGAVQDVNYASTGFYRKEFHYNHDPTQELLAQYTAQQQDDVKLYASTTQRIRRLRRLTYTSVDAEEPMNPDDGKRMLLKTHEENCKLDLKFEHLSPEIRDVLSSDGIGLRELLEGPEYPGIIEDDEAELKRGRVEAPSEVPEEPVFWG